MQNPVSPAFHQESEILLRWRKSIVKRPQRQTVRHAQLFQRKDLGLRTAKSAAKVQEHVAVAVDQLVWRINTNSNCSASTAAGLKKNPLNEGSLTINFLKESSVSQRLVEKSLEPPWLKWSYQHRRTICVQRILCFLCLHLLMTNNYKWFKSFCGSSHDTNWSWFPAKKSWELGEFSFTARHRTTASATASSMPPSHFTSFSPMDWVRSSIAATAWNTLRLHTHAT